eukprot:5770301-Pleurochrysis_carterae.AAC.1
MDALNALSKVVRAARSDRSCGFHWRGSISKGGRGEAKQLALSVEQLGTRQCGRRRGEGWRVLQASRRHRRTTRPAHGCSVLVPKANGAFVAVPLEDGRTARKKERVRCFRTVGVA